MSYLLLILVFLIVATQKKLAGDSRDAYDGTKEEKYQI